MAESQVCTYKVEIRIVEQREDGEIVKDGFSVCTNDLTEARRFYRKAAVKLVDAK